MGQASPARAGPSKCYLLADGDICPIRVIRVHPRRNLSSSPAFRATLVRLYESVDARTRGRISRGGADYAEVCERQGALGWLGSQGRPRLLADASCRPEVDEQTGPSGETRQLGHRRHAGGISSKHGYCNPAAAGRVWRQFFLMARYIFGSVMQCTRLLRLGSVIRTALALLNHLHQVDRRRQNRLPLWCRTRFEDSLRKVVILLAAEHRGSQAAAVWRFCPRLQDVVYALIKMLRAILKPC
jgi:hypothetical protein